MKKILGQFLEEVDPIDEGWSKNPTPSSHKQRWLWKRVDAYWELRAHWKPLKTSKYFHVNFVQYNETYIFTVTQNFMLITWRTYNSIWKLLFLLLDVIKKKKIAFLRTLFSSFGYIFKVTTKENKNFVFETPLFVGERNY